MASPDNIKDRYVDELIASASMIDSMESAAVAEAWASGAVAEWAALGGGQGQLGDLVREASALGAELIDWMEGGDVPSAAPAGDGDIEWVADVGVHELTRAVVLTQNGGVSEDGLILEYTGPSGARHDMSVTIVDGAVAGIAIGPEGLASAAIEDEQDGLDVESISVDDALGRIRIALSQPIPVLSAAAEATLPLLIQRAGTVDSDLAGFAPRDTDRTLPDRDDEDDRYAADVVRSGLRKVLAEEPGDSVRLAHEQFTASVAAADPDALTALDVAGVAAADIAQLDAFVRVVGGYLAPVDLSAHTDPQFGALIELEPADWVGVVLGAARALVGSDVDGDVMVRFINKAPEITTTIPKADAPRLSWTFEQMLFSWQVTGVLDDDGALSAAARWLLPQAALAAWT